MAAQPHCIPKIRCITALLVLLVLSVALCGFSANAENEGNAEKAKDICSGCELSTSGNKNRLYRLYDGILDDPLELKGEGEQFVHCDLKGKEAAGIYIKWDTAPQKWTLKVSLENGETTETEYGANGFLQDYIELPEGTVAFTIMTTDGKKYPMVFLELEVYTPGLLPDSVHIWDPTPSTAELMVISTHQDDEMLFFGGTIPYYGGELEYDTVVVYMAYDNGLRLHEAMEGLWVCGVRQHPVFVRLPDAYSKSLDGARLTWKDADVVKKLSALLAKYRPQVVVSHDINGEYGHGQHIMTVHCLRQALEKAADSTYMSENLPDMQCWTVQKCYLHLYEKNQISMPWDTMKLPSLGNRTALDAAKLGFKQHVSQQKTGFSVSTKPWRYDCRLFGLYWSKVGADVNKNDFFENITLRYVHVGMPEQIPDYLQKAGSTGAFYKRVNSDGSVDYVRYCSINGVTNWYAADNTGCPLLPAVPYVLFEDIEADIAEYETLTQISSMPMVYRYDNGIVSTETYLRYGTLFGGETGYYPVDAEGGFIHPVVPLEISKQRADKNTDSVVMDPSNGAMSFFNRLFPGCSQFEIVLIISVMAVVLLAAISLVAVITMAAKNKKSRKRRIAR